MYEIAALLLQEGASTGKVAGCRFTPLTLASFKGHLDIVKLLTEHGADINIVDSDGDTPLTAACRKGQAEVCSFLIKKGADINKLSEKMRKSVCLGLTIQ